MNRSMNSIPSAAIALLIGLSGPILGVMAQVPTPESSAGPALTGFEGNTLVAWAGESGIGVHGVYYATYNGGWSAEASIPGATTMTAPALGVVNGRAYLATTPADRNDEIVYYTSTGGDFGSNGTALCDGDTCAHTRATPALAASATTLFAAWTTANGAIQYAENTNGVWRISDTPVPNALTSPTTGPTLAVYGNSLYVAWVTPSGETVEVESATLPLTSRSWSAPTPVPAHTGVAPALAVLDGIGSENVYALYLAWTTPDETLDFAYLDDATMQWVRTNAPVPLPTGPLTVFSPALNSHPVPAPADGETRGGNAPSATVRSDILNSLCYTGKVGSEGQGPVKCSGVLRSPP